MKARLPLSAIIITLLLLASALAAACGGGRLSLEDYMAEFDRLDEQYEDRGSELGRRLEEDIALVVSDEEAVLDLYREFFADASQALNALVFDIDALNPPAKAEAIQNRAVTAGRVMAAAFDVLRDELQDVTSEAGFTAAFESFEAASEGDEFSQACDDMQALAEANGIEVTLSCN